MRPTAETRTSAAVADVLGEVRLVAGADRDARVRDEPAGGDVEEVGARVLGPPGHGRRLLLVPAALGPVGRREAHEERHPLADLGAHGARRARAAAGRGSRGCPPHRSSRRFESGDRNWCTRYPCAAWTSTTSNPASTARRAARRKSSITASTPASSSATGSRSPSNATATRPTRSASRPRRAAASPSGASVSGQTDALRPACASWMPDAAPCERMNRVIRLHASACSSFQRPVSWSEMRPSGPTAVASATTSPAPPAAIEPRCTRCQSCGHAVALGHRVLAERRHPDAIADREVADRDRAEERRRTSAIVSSDRGDGLGPAHAARLRSQASSDAASVNTWPSPPTARAPSTFSALLSTNSSSDGGDAELVDHVLVDRRIRLDQPELAADEHALEQRREGSGTEPAREVGARVREQGEPGAAVGEGVQHAQGAGVDAQPAAVVDRPQLVHVDRIPLDADVARDGRPVLGDRRRALVERLAVRPVGRPERAPSPTPARATSRSRSASVGSLGDHLAVVEHDDARGEADRCGGCRRHPPQPIVGA